VGYSAFTKTGSGRNRGPNYKNSRRRRSRQRLFLEFFPDRTREELAGTVVRVAVGIVGLVDL